MANRAITFFLPFATTPFQAPVPVKALTSAGKRFDVACRMLREVLRADEGFTPATATCWFGAGAGGSPVIRLDIDINGVKLDAVASELRLASTLDNAIRAGDTGTLSITVLDARDGLVPHVIGGIQAFKERTGGQVVLLHETGQAVVGATATGIDVSWDVPRDRSIAFVVGSHDGFPPDLEGAVRRACDACISLSPVSYLGSHVIRYLRLLA